MKCIICNNEHQNSLTNGMVLCAGHAEDYNLDALAFISTYRAKIEATGHVLKVDIKVMLKEDTFMGAE